MAQKMQFCFAIISAETLLHILGYSSCTNRQNLAHFGKMLLSLKSPKIICANSALFWHQKYW
jgi:hypothetical protein